VCLCASKLKKGGVGFKRVIWVSRFLCSWACFLAQTCFRTTMGEYGNTNSSVHEELGAPKEVAPAGLEAARAAELFVVVMLELVGKHSSEVLTVIIEDN
jgi:hypothetical protein